jgi:acyl-CoA synthetase (AMP-forming)/AMP-acid ligase II
MIVFAPGLQFLVCLMGCMKAGVIGVPTYPPDPSKLGKEITQFKGIQSDCGATVALTHNYYNYAKKMASIKNMFSSSGDDWPAMDWYTVDAAIQNSKTRTLSQTPFVIDHESIAFLQYTSGSTSTPKGVMLSFRNVLDNAVLSVTFNGSILSDDSSVVAVWLPQYHDMGLIGM